MTWCLTTYTPTDFQQAQTTLTWTLQVFEATIMLHDARWCSLPAVLDGDTRVFNPNSEAMQSITVKQGSHSSCDDNNYKLTSVFTPSKTFLLLCNYHWTIISEK